MKPNYLTLIAALLAGVVGGIGSQRIFVSPTVEAAGKTLSADTIRANHIVVSGDITIQTSSRDLTKLLVLQNSDGDSFVISSDHGLGTIGIQISNGTQPKPYVVLNSLGLSVWAQDPTAPSQPRSAHLAQLNPNFLKFTTTNQSSTTIATNTSTLDPFQLQLISDDLKPADKVTTTVNYAGFSYEGKGKNAKLPSQ